MDFYFKTNLAAIRKVIKNSDTFSDLKTPKLMYRNAFKKVYLCKGGDGGKVYLSQVREDFTNNDIYSITRGMRVKGDASDEIAKSALIQIYKENPSIEYELFNTTMREISLDVSEIFSELTWLAPEKKSIPSYKDVEIEKCWHYKDLTICIGDQLYLIFQTIRTKTGKKERKLIGGFEDSKSHYQLGDDDTVAYVNEVGDIVIDNSGDAASIVVIKLN